MKKFSLSILVSSALLVVSNAQALPINASGAGSDLNMENSTMVNTVKSDNDKKTDNCASGICNMFGDDDISITGSRLTMTNSTMINTIDSTNGNNNRNCASGICNMGQRK